MIGPKSDIFEYYIYIYPCINPVVISLTDVQKATGEMASGCTGVQLPKQLTFLSHLLNVICWPIKESGSCNYFMCHEYIKWKRLVETRKPGEE